MPTKIPCVLSSCCTRFHSKQLLLVCEFKRIAKRPKKSHFFRSFYGVLFCTDFSGILTKFNPKYTPKYYFDQQISIQLTTHSAQGVDASTTLIFYFLKGHDRFGMEISGEAMDVENGKIILIFDTEHSKMLTLLESEGQKLAMMAPLDEDELEKTIAIDASHEASDLDWKKTGVNKEIFGYKCDQYLITNSNGKGDAWISNSPDLHVGKAMNWFNQSDNDQINLDYPEGSILEMHLVDADGATVDWITTKISTDSPLEINTQGYAMMPLGQ
jgi:hypothetical protein